MPNKTIKPLADYSLNMLSHELRTPLTTIIGCIGLIKIKTDRGQAVPKKLIQLIEVEAKRMKSLVTKLSTVKLV